jgi:hypothetical protein
MRSFWPCCGFRRRGIKTKDVFGDKLELSSGSVEESERDRERETERETEQRERQRQRVRSRTSRE